MKKLSMIITLISIISLLMSCKSDGQQKTPDTGSMITKGYSVTTADQQVSKGEMKFMEVEDFDKGILMKKSYFDGQSNLNGYEVFEYQGKADPQVSNYYAQDGSQLAKYELQYENGLKVLSKGYDANTDELLRIEKYKYDDLGNMVRKSIYDAADVLQKSYSFEHDKDGNELKMIVRNGEGKILLYEDYEIVEQDTSGRWMKKWGYLNGNNMPTTYQECSRSDFK